MKCALMYAVCGACTYALAMKMIQTKHAQEMLKDLEKKKVKTYKFIRSMM